MADQRRVPRAPIEQPLMFRRGSKATLTPGVGKDISVGGMFIETVTPAAFGCQVVVVTELPGQNGVFTLAGVVRWTTRQGMGLQFGFLGARETHAITEITRVSSETAQLKSNP